jgi:hypothetical protein
VDRNRVILEEADRWREEGRISPQFHAWLRERYRATADATTTSILQRVLLVAGGLLFLVAMFTLVGNVWDHLTPLAQTAAALLLTLASTVVGIVLYRLPRLRLLAHVFLPLALPLLLLTMSSLAGVQYPETGRFRWEANRLTNLETAALLLGPTAALAALVGGLRMSPTLAVAAALALPMTLNYLADYTYVPVAWEPWLRVGLFLLVALLHLVIALLWTGIIPWRGWWPAATRLAWAANGPWGFGLLVSLGRNVLPEEPLIAGTSMAAVYLSILLLAGLRLGLPELSGVSALLLVLDGLILSFDYGGLVGTVLVLLAAAAILLALAQRGVLGRIVRPRAPPAEPRLPKVGPRRTARPPRKVK